MKDFMFLLLCILLVVAFIWLVAMLLKAAWYIAPFVLAGCAIWVFYCAWKRRKQK